MGHADLSMTMRYSHPTPESKCNAVALLARGIESSRSLADAQKVADGVSTEVVEKYGTPGAIRTHDTRFRKPPCFVRNLL